MKKTLLCAESITKSYVSGNTQLAVLKGVSFDLIHGEIAVLLGASGSGKSTLLNILAGIDKLDTGKVIMKETEISSLDDNMLTNIRNRDIGFIFQFHNLLSDFNVIENVMIPAMIAGLEYDEARSKAQLLLEEVGMSDRCEHKPGEISGGEAQRVAVARAMINEPDLILADEPTGNLDRFNGQKLVSLLVDLNLKKERTFLIATHNQELLPNVRKFMLLDGQVHEC
ncbi:MAG: ABC transporter ATP-binding protein [candidate division Zixibacteria bacterium]|nr:ABC transporter ATP-binding protein [candidate division Zixibacteria bacterium]